MLKYSFVIPVKEINSYIRELIPKILLLKRGDFEIIVYPDVATGENWEKTRQIASGAVESGRKKKSGHPRRKRGNLIFLDDDAYPENNFLDILDRDFAEQRYRGGRADRRSRRERANFGREFPALCF